jgi:hypothetical protein
MKELGPLFVGVDRRPDGYKYARDLLKKSSMADCKPAMTPTTINKHLHD